MPALDNGPTTRRQPRATITKNFSTCCWFEAASRARGDPPGSIAARRSGNLTCQGPVPARGTPQVEFALRAHTGLVRQSRTAVWSSRCSRSSLRPCRPLRGLGRYRAAEFASLTLLASCSLGPLRVPAALGSITDRSWHFASPFSSLLIFNGSPLNTRSNFMPRKISHEPPDSKGRGVDRWSPRARICLLNRRSQRRPGARRGGPFCVRVG